MLMKNIIKSKIEFDFIIDYFGLAFNFQRIYFDYSNLCYHPVNCKNINYQNLFASLKIINQFFKNKKLFNIIT